MLTLVVGKSAIRICFQKLFKVNVKTNFNSCSSRGSTKSDSDFLVPALNVANNLASLANLPKLIEFFQTKCPPGTKSKFVW